MRRSSGPFSFLVLLSVTLLAGIAPASTYDLPADREARVELARRELGAKTPATVVEDVFVVVGSTEGVPLIKSALAAYFNQRFDRRPEQAISVYLFAGAKSYEAYCQEHFEQPCISSYGFYLPSLRRIVMNAGPGLGTLTHELVHPIMETDFPRAPTWLDEGIASLFEAPVMPRAGEIHGRKNWRYPRLVGALASAGEKERVSIEHLFSLTDEQFRGQEEGLNYALARYVCQWLDERGKLWPFYRAFRDGYTSDASGRQAFVSVTGESPEAATPTFRRWLKALR